MSPSIPPTLDRGVFGWDAVKLYRNYSIGECEQALAEICADPDAANPAHAVGKSIHLYTKAASKRIDALGWAVFYHQQDKAGASA